LINNVVSEPCGHRNALRDAQQSYRSALPLTPEPSDVASRLTGRDYLSPSAIGTYQSCPLKFFFRYVAGLEPEFVSSSLVFGSAIHAAIQRHFTAVFEGLPLPSLDELLQVYDDAWKSRAETTIRFGKNETVEGLRDLATRMLEAFQRSDVAKLDSGLLGVEEEFRGPVIKECPDIFGRVDLLVKDADGVRIIDFKTSRSRWNQAKVQQAAQPMLLYAELVKPLATGCGQQTIKLTWCVLTKTKEPSVELFSMTPDKHDMARTKAVVQRVWKAIGDKHFYPAPSSMNCSSCPFSTACRKWEG